MKPPEGKELYWAGRQGARVHPVVFFTRSLSVCLVLSRSKMAACSSARRRNSANARHPVDVYLKKRKIFAYLVYKYYVKENNRRYWVHPFVSARHLKGAFATMFIELREDESKFLNYFRMTVRTFDELSAKLSDKIQGTDTNMRLAVPPTEMLAVTLRYLGSGCNFKDLHDSFRLGKSTIGTIARKVCSAVCSHLRDECLPAFSKEKWLEISEGYQKQANFPNCLGAIDAKYVRITKPDKNGFMVFKHKKFFYLVLLGIVDTNYLFTFVDVETPENDSDADSYSFENNVFCKKMANDELDIPENSPLPGTLAPEMPFVFLADEAFDISSNVLRPYTGRILPHNKRVFNYRLNRGRRFVESAFALLTNKWGIFHKPLNVEHTFAVDIIKCCCILHNFVRSRDGYEMEELLIIHGLYDIAHSTPSRRGGLHLNQMRTAFADYFVSDAGKLSWQDRLI